MKTKKNTYSKISFLLGVLMMTTISCERYLSDEAEFATFSNNPDVFTDNFVGMGTNFYFPFVGDGAKPDVFSVDDTEGYESEASIRIDVPNANDPAGSFAGFSFVVDGASRDLTQYDALTFWAKSSQAANIGAIGFGEGKYQALRSNVDFTTNWTKFIIPIPDPSKLVAEKGMFLISAGGIGDVPGQEVGYTFWLDEIKFETLGTVAQPRPKMLNGVDTTQESFSGAEITLSGLTQTYNVASGEDITVSASPSYFTFSSSDIAVARVSELGIVSVFDEGTATITASLGNESAAGSLTINSGEPFQFATAPTLPQSDVISLFSDTYTDVNVDNYNPYWQGSTTQGEQTTISGQGVISYTTLNYVAAVVTTTNPVDASAMTHLHLDILTSDAPADFIIKIKDFGANNADGGGDDTEIAYTIPSSQITSDEWVSLDISLSNFVGLNNKANIGFIIIESGGINTLYMDNIYFHK